MRRTPTRPSDREFTHDPAGGTGLGQAGGSSFRFGYELGGGAVSVTVTVLVTVLGGDVWVWVIVCVPPVITVVCAPPLLSPATSTPTSTPITRAATIPATASAIRGDVHPSFDGAGGGEGPGCGGGGWEVIAGRWYPNSTRVAGRPPGLPGWRSGYAAQLVQLLIGSEEAGRCSSRSTS